MTLTEQTQIVHVEPNTDTVVMWDGNTEFTVYEFVDELNFLYLETYSGYPDTLKGAKIMGEDYYHKFLKSQRD